MAGKRGNGEGTINHRADGRWEGRLTVGVNPATGKLKMKSVYGKTRAEVVDKLKVIRREMDDRGKYIDPTKLTVAQWLDKWAEDYLVNVRVSTATNYSYHIRHNIKPALGAIKLSALTTADIQKHLIKKKLDEGLNPKTIRNMHCVLREALNQAVEDDLIVANPCFSTKLPRWVKKDITPLDAEQVQQFMQAIRYHKYESLFIVTVFTGMRQGEVLGLTWDCVDFKNGLITVNKQLQKERVEGGGGEYRLKETKTKKSKRTIMPAPFVMAELKKVRLNQKTMKLKAGDQWQHEANLVFTNEYGGHCCADTIYCSFKRVMKRLNFDATRFHDLRHTYATLALQNGDDLKTVSENLGHSDITTTGNIYAHVNAQMKQASADRMEALIQAIK